GRSRLRVVDLTRRCGLGFARIVQCGKKVGGPLPTPEPFLQDLTICRNQPFLIPDLEQFPADRPVLLAVIGLHVPVSGRSLGPQILFFLASSWRAASTGGN